MCAHRGRYVSARRAAPSDRPQLTVFRVEGTESAVVGCADEDDPPAVAIGPPLPGLPVRCFSGRLSVTPSVTRHALPGVDVVPSAAPRWLLAHHIQILVLEASAAGRSRGAVATAPPRPRPAFAAARSAKPWTWPISLVFTNR